MRDQQSALNIRGHLTVVNIKPQSHRIVRFIDRSIGGNLAVVRPVGNVGYDLCFQSHTAIVFHTGTDSRYTYTGLGELKIGGSTNREVVQLVGTDRS